MRPGLKTLAIVFISIGMFNTLLAVSHGKPNISGGIMGVVFGMSLIFGAWARGKYDKRKSHK